MNSCCKWCMASILAISMTLLRSMDDGENLYSPKMTISPSRVGKTAGSGGKIPLAEELVMDEIEKFVGGDEGRRFSRVSLAAVCVRLSLRLLSLYDEDSEGGPRRSWGGAPVTIAQI